jgi:hypothetical protein
VKNQFPTLRDETKVQVLQFQFPEPKPVPVPDPEEVEKSKKQVRARMAIQIIDKTNTTMRQAQVHNGLDELVELKKMFQHLEN